jgi:RNA polymerase sigma factor (TIGR02999 family)
MGTGLERLHDPGPIESIFDEMRRAGRSDEEIFRAAYADLKILARKMLSRDHAGDSMNASRLMSDLWVRLFGKSPAEFQWESGHHFFNLTARAMRQLLIDYARRRRAARRGDGDVEQLDILANTSHLVSIDSKGTMYKNALQEKADKTLMLERALDQLERDNARQAKIVDLRVFGGLTEDEAAAVLGVSSETVTKEFAKAKVRLRFYSGNL